MPKEFIYSFHLNNLPHISAKATIGDLRDLLRTLDLLALPDEQEIEECELSIYFTIDHYPYISDKGYIKP